MWGEITYPFTNFNDAIVQVWEWISNFVPHITGNVITYPQWDLIKSMLVKALQDASNMERALSRDYHFEFRFIKRYLIIPSAVAHRKHNIVNAMPSLPHCYHYTFVVHCEIEINAVNSTVLTGSRGIDKAEQPTIAQTQTRSKENNRQIIL